MKASAVVLVASALMACGGAAPPSAPTDARGGGGAGANDAVGHCLAVAGAKHPARSDEPAKITVSHILVPYSSSKRASSSVTRTREQACLRAAEARTKLADTAFGDVVKAYSEEPGAASREGSIGAVTRTMLVPAFSDAAFELQPGEVSQVVETDFGFHVILRTQ